MTGINGKWMSPVSHLTPSPLVWYGLIHPLFAGTHAVLSGN